MYERQWEREREIQNGRPMWFIFFIHIAKLFFLSCCRFFLDVVENENSGKYMSLRGNLWLLLGCGVFWSMCTTIILYCDVKYFMRHWVWEEKINDENPEVETLKKKEMKSGNFKSVFWLLLIFYH